MVTYEFSEEDFVSLIGTLDGIIESLDQARVIKNDNTRELAFDNIEFRIEGVKENLKHMFETADVIHINK